MQHLSPGSLSPAYRIAYLTFDLSKTRPWLGIHFGPLKIPLLVDVMCSSLQWGRKVSGSFGRDWALLCWDTWVHVLGTRVWISYNRPMLYYKTFSLFC